jgi:mRNA deadenylase 3'-5' endonuclease subunit Ccr4
VKDKSIIYEKDNICLFGIFSFKKDPSTCFIIANTHLLFNEKRGDIKLAQAYQILRSIHILKEHFSERFKHVNLMLCGDFNSAPNSGIYKLITEGKVDCTTLDKKKVKIFLTIR